jgi:hypothetical protein
VFLGTTQTEEGSTYDKTQNPLLEQGVTATTDLNGHKVTQPISNADYATKAAADSFARVLAAGVMEVGTFGTAVSSVPRRFLVLPSGGFVAAGNIAMILGNDAFYPPGVGGNLNVKSGAIADICGIPYQKGLAEALMASVGGAA